MYRIICIHLPPEDMTPRGVHPQPLVPVLLNLLATAIENPLIAIALAAYFVPLLVPLGELDYLVIFHFFRSTDGTGSRTL